MKTKYMFSLKSYKPALIAALFFGLVTPASKFLANNLPPQSMAGLLYVSAGFGLLAILLFKKNFLKAFSMVHRKDYKWFTLATVFGGLLGPAFLTYGVHFISGSTASLLLNLEAVLTSLIAWSIFKEHFEKKIVYGMILIILGCLTLSLNSAVTSGADTPLGFFLICLACLSWGIDNNVTRNISHLDPPLIASFKGLIAGSSNLVLGYGIGERLILNFEVLQIGVVGFLGIGVSLVRRPALPQPLDRAVRAAEYLLRACSSIVTAAGDEHAFDECAAERHGRRIVDDVDCDCGITARTARVSTGCEL